METRLKIKVNYKEGADKLKEIDKGDWIDMYAYEDYDYKVGDFFMVDLGVAMQLPEGYEAHLAPRSSTFKKYGLVQTNGVGVIDETYCGNNDIWMMPVFCESAPAEPANEPTGRTYHIKKGDRLCQFRIVKKMPKILFDETDDLGNEARGGFGSTGV